MNKIETKPHKKIALFAAFVVYSNCISRSNKCLGPTFHFPLAAAVVFIILAGCFAAVAQTPETIEIKSLTISNHVIDTEQIFMLVTANSSGAEVVYRGLGSFANNEMAGCFPCRLPKTFQTNSFYNGGINSFSFQIAADSFITFLSFPGGVGPDKYRPAIHLETRDIVINGNASFQGRVEITNSHGTVIAKADNVSLQGGYAATFHLSYFPDLGRLLTANQINYFLTKSTAPRPAK